MTLLFNVESAITILIASRTGTIFISKRLVKFNQNTMSDLKEMDQTMLEWTNKLTNTITISPHRTLIFGGR